MKSSPSKARAQLFGAAVLALASLPGCSASGPAERTGRTSSAIINGRESGPAEDAAVRVYGTPGSLDAGLTDQFCSGHLLAPNLALTARHCVLRISEESVHNLNCNPDGTITDPTDPNGTQTTPLSPSGMTVYVGDEIATEKAYSVTQIIIDAQIGLCESDMAFLVLASAALDVHVPVRGGAVRVNEQFSLAGWGYTSDDAEYIGRPALPTSRYALDNVPITGIGPGLMPADTFSSGGSTGCFGDSGAVALIDGVAVGVFSHIAGPGSANGLPSCEAQGTTDYFTMIGAHLDLVRTAFAAAGDTPVIACPDACSAGETCDTTQGQCVPLSDAGPDADATSAPAETNTPETSSSGCAMAPVQPASGSVVAGFAAMGALLLRKRRRTRACRRQNR